MRDETCEKFFCDILPFYLPPKMEVGPMKPLFLAVPGSKNPRFFNAEISNGPNSNISVGSSALTNVTTFGEPSGFTPTCTSCQSGGTPAAFADPGAALAGISTGTTFVAPAMTSGGGDAANVRTPPLLAVCSALLACDRKRSASALFLSV